MTDAQIRPAFTLKGWHILGGMLLFFGADIAVNTVFMMDAYRTYPGEGSQTPYEDGLVYNRALKQRQAQAALGWSVTADAVPDSVVRVRVLDKAGAPLSGLRVTGDAQRPATEAGHRTLAFRETSPGTYLAPVIGLHGAWDLALTAIGGQGREARGERRLVLP